MYRFKEMYLLALPAPSTLLPLFVSMCVLCVNVIVHMCGFVCGCVHEHMCLFMWKSEVNVKYLL